MCSGAKSPTPSEIYDCVSLYVPIENTTSNSEENWINYRRPFMMSTDAFIWNFRPALSII